MSVRNLDYLFKPESVAVIGASNRSRSVGQAVMQNLLAGGFGGPVMPVNPRHEAVSGVLAYPDVAALPLAPDLAVVCTPAPTVPGLIEALGEEHPSAMFPRLHLGRLLTSRGKLDEAATMLEAARAGFEKTFEASHEANRAVAAALADLEEAS